MRQVPDSVRIAGWIAAAVGGLLTLFAITMIFSYAVEPEAARPAPGAPVGPIADLLFSHFGIVLVVYAAIAALMAGSGLELSQGREGGRRRLVVALWAAVVSIVAVAVVVVSFFLTMPAPSSELTELLAGVSGRAFRRILVAGGIAGAVQTSGVGALLYLAIRWLNSPAVRAACHAGDTNS